MPNSTKFRLFEISLELIDVFFQLVMFSQIQSGHDSNNQINILSLVIVMKSGTRKSETWEENLTFLVPKPDRRNDTQTRTALPDFWYPKTQNPGGKSDYIFLSTRTQLEPDFCYPTTSLAFVHICFIKTTGWSIITAITCFSAFPKHFRPVTTIFVFVTVISIFCILAISRSNIQMT